MTYRDECKNKNFGGVLHDNGAELNSAENQTEENIMTVHELKQVYRLAREMTVLSNQGKDKNASSEKSISDKLYEARIAQIKDVLAIKRKRCIDWVYSIDNSKIRQVIILRYIKALPWREVALEMSEGKTADCYRMAVKRYIARHGN